MTAATILIESVCLKQKLLKCVHINKTASEGYQRFFKPSLPLELLFFFLSLITYIYAYMGVGGRFATEAVKSSQVTSFLSSRPVLSQFYLCDQQLNKKLRKFEGCEKSSAD